MIRNLLILIGIVFLTSCSCQPSYPDPDYDAPCSGDHHLPTPLSYYLHSGNPYYGYSPYDAGYAAGSYYSHTGYREYSDVEEYASGNEIYYHSYHYLGR